MYNLFCADFRNATAGRRDFRGRLARAVFSQLYGMVGASATTRNYPTRSPILAFLIHITAMGNATEVM
jgi:hypothetical protein